MTEKEILFNYNQAMKQASKLEDVARQLDKLAADKIESAMGTLKASWQSDNSSQYYIKVEKVQNDMKTTAGKIKAAARSIRTSSEAMKQAELRALEIAQSRTYC